jgi:hypothetical protein
MSETNKRDSFVKRNGGSERRFCLEKEKGL